MLGLYSTDKNLIGLVEAYNSIYDNQEDIENDALQIIEDFSYLFFLNGYGVDDLITYFNESSTDEIIEAYINIIENNALLENVSINEEFVEEQFDILNEKLGQILSKVGTVFRRTGQAGRHAPRPAGQANRPPAAPSGQSGSHIPRPSGQVKKPKTAPTATSSNPLQRATSALSRPVNAAKNLIQKIPAPVRTAGKVIGRSAIPVLTGVAAAADERAKGSGWGRSIAKGVTSAAGSTLGGAAGNVLGAATGPLRVVAAPALSLGGSIAGEQLASKAFDKLAGPNARERAAQRKSKWNASASSGGQTAFKAGGGSAAMKSGASVADIQRRGMTALRSNKWNASAGAGGQTAFKAGGGSAAMKSGASAADIQRRGMTALKSREQTPNTAAGFDSAFASARKLGQKSFKWRGGEYTTQMAHTDLLDLVRGHLINEGYAQDLNSANKILENMGEGWFNEIINYYS